MSDAAKFQRLTIRNKDTGGYGVWLDGVDIGGSVETVSLNVGGPGPAEAWLKFSVFLDVDVAAEIRRTVGLPQVES